MYSIKTNTPEALGIPSAAIQDIINRLEEYTIPIHSLLIAKDNQLVVEGYYSPYNKDTLHRMFSVSKTFTALAIGKMADEGRLSLSDPIIQHFPEYLPDNIHPFLSAMTIEDMLTMRTCYSATTYKHDMTTNWVESFFTGQPSHMPGTVFNYDTSASHTLCALVEKLSGMDFIDYLKSEVFTDNELSDESYMLKDPFNTSMGGSGLMAKPMDLLMLGSLLLNKGMLNGKQIISQGFIEKATDYHTSTYFHPSQGERQGYGYQLWHTQHHGFMAYGMGGQYAICLPDYKMVIVTTADTQGLKEGNQLIFNTIYELLLPYIKDVPLTEDIDSNQTLSNQLETLSISPLEKYNPSLADFELKSHDFLNGRYKIIESHTTFSELEIKIASSNDAGTLIFHTALASYTLHFGIGHTVIDKFPIHNDRCATSGQWVDENTFYIYSHLIEECIGCVQIYITRHGDYVTVSMKKIEETMYSDFNGYLTLVR